MDHLIQTEGRTGVKCERGKKIQKVTEHVVISDFLAAKAVRRLSAGLNEGVEYGSCFSNIDNFLAHQSYINQDLQNRSALQQAVIK